LLVKNVGIKHKMEKQDVQNKERKTVTISIRTYPSYAEWIKDNNVSPNKVFDKAMEELIEKNGKGK